MLERLKQRRVVICDDSRTILAMLEEAFTSHAEFRVVGVASGAAEAVELIKQHSPDLITIDLCMPYIDGTALLGMLLDAPNVCKIVVSDQTTKSAALSAKLKSLGATACVSKALLSRDRAKFFLEIGLACKRHEARPRHLPKRTLNLVESTGNGPAVDKNSVVDFGYPIPFDEKSRLELMARKSLGNSVRERYFDLLTKYVAETTSYPMCFLNFVDADVMWVKSFYCLEAHSFPRNESFCSYTVGQYTALVVEDAAKDRRFAHYPSVAGPLKVRTYVGQPIIASDGTRIGSLCILDQVVRHVSGEVKAHLESIATIIAEIINSRPDTLGEAKD